MSTSKRTQANRANAAKSTGPRSPQGKARSAQNARKHGFAAAQYSVVRLEELDSLSNLRADAIAVYQPVNSQELFAVERIAIAQQALLRVAALEAGFHTSFLNDTLSPRGEPQNLIDNQLARDVNVARSQNRSLCLAVGFQRQTSKSESFKLFLRYQAQTERLFRRAIEEFERLKALRHELPNEPIPIPETDPVLPEKLLPPPPPLTEDEVERIEWARIDPTVAVPYFPPKPLPPDE